MTPLDAYNRAVSIAHDHATFYDDDLTRSGDRNPEVKLAVAIVAYLLHRCAGLSTTRTAETLGRAAGPTLVPRWLARLSDEQRQKLDADWANYPIHADAKHWGPIA